MGSDWWVVLLVALAAKLVRQVGWAALLVVHQKNLVPEEKLCNPGIKFWDLGPGNPPQRTSVNTAAIRTRGKERHYNLS